MQAFQDNRYAPIASQDFIRVTQMPHNALPAIWVILPWDCQVETVVLLAILELTETYLHQNHVSIVQLEHFKTKQESLSVMYVRLGNFNLLQDSAIVIHVNPACIKTTLGNRYAMNANLEGFKQT